MFTGLKLPLATPHLQPEYDFRAISNGSQCGVGVLPVGGNLVNGSASVNGSGALITLQLLLSYVTTGVPLAVITKLKYKTDLQANGLSGNSTHEILYYKLQRLEKLFFVINNNKTFVELHRGEPSFNTVPWESVPGGTQSIGDRVGTGSGDLSGNWAFIAPWFVGYNYSATLAPAWSFVPVTSSLDISNPASNFDQYIFSVNGRKGSTASTYVAQEYNASQGGFNINHTNFTARNSRWIYNEMETITQPIDCDEACVPTSLNGPEAFCNSANYYLNGTGGNLTWTITPSYQDFVTSTITGGTIHLAQADDYIIRNGNSGEITLTANYNAACGGGTFTKTIFVGAKPPTFVVNAPFGNCAGQSFEAIATPTQSYGTVSYNWYLNGNLQSYHGYKLRSNFTSNSGNYIGVQLVTSTCGTSQENYQYFSCGNFRPAAPESFTVSPVPAKNTITITGIDAFSFSAVEIVNKTGSIVKQWQLPKETKTTKLNIAGLPTDVYYIKVFDGKEWKGKSITVQ